MKFIKLNNKIETIVNLEYIEFIETKHIEGSNPYFELCIGFTSGKYKEIRYEIYEEQKLCKDISGLNDRCD